MSMKFYKTLLLLAVSLTPPTPTRAEDAAAAPGQETESSSRGSDWHLLELDELKVDWQRYYFPNFNPYYPSPKNDEISLTARAVIGKVFFWDTQIHGWSDSAQYRQVGLEVKLGLQVTRHLDLYYRHHSQHLLDKEGPNHFPVEDAFGVTLYFVRGGAIRKGVF